MFLPVIGAIIGAAFGGWLGFLIGGYAGYLAGIALQRFFIGGRSLECARAAGPRTLAPLQPYPPANNPLVAPDQAA